MTENEINLNLALEKLNVEYLELKNSREYSLGLKIINNFNLIKKIKISTIIRNRLIMKKYKRLCNINPQYDFKVSNNITYERKPKIAVYTCITGDYDNLKEPLYYDKEIDYFVFTDNKNFKNKLWKRKDIPIKLLSFKDNILINRYLKFHPYEFFKEYDFTIYIDGNVRIISDIKPLFSMINPGVGVAMHNHSNRDCIYLEAEACKLFKKGNKKKLDNQISKYKNDGFPKNFGLLEATIIITDINNYNSQKIFNLWWDEFLNSGSYRDQISLPYVLWKNGYCISDIGTLGNNLYKNPKFQVTKHN